MKKKFLFTTIAAVVSILLAVLAEVVIFNFKPITSADNSISEISYTTEKTDNKIRLKLDVNQKYIRQLLIEYSTTEDIEYDIEYTHQSAYGRETTDTFSDIFDNSFTLSATNLDTTVSEVIISYDYQNSEHHPADLKISQILADNAFHFNYFRACLIFLILITLYAIIFFYKDGFRTEKTHVYFAVICTLLGLMIITAQPAMTFYCWDDQVHFDRVVNIPLGTIEYSTGEYNLSNGSVANSTWPRSTDSFTEHRTRSNYLDRQGTTEYTGDTPTTFLPIHKIPYLPMAAGYNLAKSIGLPFTICFQIGKIFNLLFYVLLMTYAIKSLRTGKRLLSIIAFLPSNIFLACEYSYDPAVFTGITIFLVQLFNLLTDKDKKSKLDFKTVLIMIASMTYACLAKAIYAPLLLLVLLIPKDRFKNLKQARLVKTGFVAISLLLCSILILPTLNGAEVSDTRGGEVSVKDQIVLVATHPTDYISVLSNTAISKFGYKLFGPNTFADFAYIRSFGDQSNFYYIFLFLILFAFFTDNAGNHLTKKSRIWSIVAILTVILLIWSALYVDFTPVGLTTINGVQNRYFLPLIFPLLFCLQFPNIQSKINPKYYNLAIFLLPVITLAIIAFQFILVPYNF